MNRGYGNLSSKPHIHPFHNPELSPIQHWGLQRAPGHACKGTLVLSATCVERISHARHCRSVQGDPDKRLGVEGLGFIRGVRVVL